MANDTISVIDDRVKAQNRVNRPPEEGVIVSVSLPFVRVQTKGSVQYKTIRCDNNPDVEVGKHVIIQWLAKSKKYVIMSIFSRSMTTNNTPNSTFELFPPNNISVAGNINNIITVQWDAPPQQAVVFEVQTNTSAIDSGAVTAIATRGSQVDLPSVVPLYIRVRSVSANFQYSSYSDWILGTPGSSSGGTGDFLRDGSTPMTGDFPLGAFGIISAAIATPSTPVTGYVSYTKSDGKWYILDSLGVETEIGSGTAKDYTAFVMTQDPLSFSNTVTETSIIPTGVGIGFTPFTFTVGKILDIALTFSYNSAASPGSLTVRLKVAGSALSNPFVINPLDPLASGAGGYLSWQLICRDNSSSGKIDEIEYFPYYDGAATFHPSGQSIIPNTGINLTSAVAIDITAQFSIADPSNYFEIDSLVIKVSDPN